GISLYRRELPSSSPGGATRKRTKSSQVKITRASNHCPGESKIFQFVSCRQDQNCELPNGANCHEAADKRRSIFALNLCFAGYWRRGSRSLLPLHPRSLVNEVMSATGRHIQAWIPVFPSAGSTISVLSRAARRPILWNVRVRSRRNSFLSLRSNRSLQGAMSSVCFPHVLFCTEKWQSNDYD